MNKKSPAVLLYLVIMLLQVNSFASDNIKLPSGKFSPLFGMDKKQTAFLVDSFELDKTPVTVNEFSLFLKSNPNWQKENISSLFAESNYLTGWQGIKTKSALKNSPVTQVSWFAASAYCENRRGRLPTTLEWEYAAASNSDKSDEEIMDWYSKGQKSVAKIEVGKQKSNLFGLHDMHGLVWEWTDDFNTFFVASDNRSDGDKSSENFCGAGSIAAKDRKSYAAFMRYAFRSSLKASYSTENLGFRCAYSKEKK